MERRKAATLEREFEQLKFSTETKDIETTDQLSSLTEQGQYMEAEGKKLQEKIDSLIREHKKRIDDERTSHNKTKSRYP
jgi:ElaB/YqjD/DUF883 family membrane-anchored ribosome-binding protein